MIDIEKIGNVEIPSTVIVDFSYIDIVFEIANIDNISNVNEPKEIIETINTKGLLASKNTPKQPIHSAEELGTLLFEILNNFNKIKKTILCEYMKLSNKAKQDWKNKNNIIKDKFITDNDKYIEERNKLVERLVGICYYIFEMVLNEFERLNPKFSIFKQFALENMIRRYNRYKSNIEELKTAVYKMERGSLSRASNNKMYQRIKEELEYVSNVDYMLQELANSVAEFVNALGESMKLIEKSFIHSNETRNNTFSGIQVQLPNTNIEYKVDGFKFPRPYKYIYEIKCVEDLFNVTIYQISLNHKVIIKCKNCGKYFIPKRTDQVFCTKKCKENYIYKNMSLGRDKEKVNLYYAKLRKRYNNNPTYHEELEKLKNLYQDCKSKQLDDEEIMKILTNFEETVKNTYTVKRGRPKKQ